MPKRLVVQMTVDQAETFYILCDLFKADSPVEREGILSYMVNRGMVKTAYTTERSEDQVKADLAKHYNVVDVRNKEEDDIPGDENDSRN